MPEGDTVWRTARALQAGLAGRVLTRAELRVPRHATAALAGRTVIETVSIGKHLLTRLEPDLTLHTHLGMDGSWTVRTLDGARGAKPLPRWPSGNSPSGAQLRAVLATADSIALGRLLARVDLVRTPEEAALVGRLGPDLCAEEFGAEEVEEAVRRLRAAPERPIGEALLDQENLAGIGNLYRAELLFLRGVRPQAPVARVPELERVVGLARELLRAGCFAPRPRAYAYRRGGRPCRRCGTPIATAQLGAAGRERVVWWCPHCQPA